MRKSKVFLFWLGVAPTFGAVAAQAEIQPEIPRINSLVMLQTSPFETDPAVIWYDDFDGRIEADRKGLNWRGPYTGYGINTVFLKKSWNLLLIDLDGPTI